MSRAVLFILICLGFYSAPILADYYKWEDDNGQVHYTKYPPADATSEKLKPTYAAPTEATAEPEDEQEAQAEPEDNENRLELGEDEQGVDAEEQARIKKEQEERQKAIFKKNCEMAKTNLHTLTASNRVRRPNANGDLEILSKSEVQNLIKKTKADVDVYCNPNQQ